MEDVTANQPPQWAHLQDLYTEFAQTQEVVERDLGFEQIGIIEKKLAYLNERLESKKSRSTKYCLPLSNDSSTKLMLK